MRFEVVRLQYGGALPKKKKERDVLTQFGYLSFIPLLHHEIQWRPTACFTFQTVIRLSRTLVNVMGECFANETVQ